MTGIEMMPGRTAHEGANSLISEAMKLNSIHPYHENVSRVTHLSSYFISISHSS
jgi:hypothetical protein